MNLVLLGPPGVGKGTQANHLAKEFDFKLISTGDILRNQVQKNTTLGLKAKKFVKIGKLVPDNIILDIIVTHTKNNHPYIFDGFPRTVKQAMGLEHTTKKRGLSLDAVIYLYCNENVIIERLSKRRVCPLCGKIYNLITNPPKNGNKCDLCNESLKQREDDREEIIKNRLKIYQRQTMPLLEFYEQKRILHKIDGSKPEKQVYETIRDVILKERSD